MAEHRLRNLGIAIWLALLALGAVLAIRSDIEWSTIALWAVAIAAAQQISVPAPSGERLFLGTGAAAAVPLLVPDAAAAGAVFAFGMAGSWLVATIRRSEVSLLGSEFIAETVALGGFGAVFFAVERLFAAAGFEGTGAGLLGIAAGGLSWYLVRASVRALIGLERDDLSARYLWLLALEDWAVIISLFATGALLGVTFPSMRWWAIPVSLMPYAFSHLAFVRYHSTRVTYGQTIRALAQIPEVAGLAPDGHSARTADLATAVARELGLHPDAVAELEYAALMHDIGRITLNEPAILRAGYTDEDIARWGAQIIAEAPYLTRVAQLVREQHRPYRRPGVERDPDVPMASKIIKVASAYDKAVNELALPPVEAVEQIHRGSAYDYDPDVTASLRRVLVHRRLIAE